jgi:hypothetical protein
MHVVAAGEQADMLGAERQQHPGAGWDGIAGLLKRFHFDPGVARLP